MGAEAIRDLLRDLDLDAEAESLRETIRTSKGQKQQRGIKVKVVNAFINGPRTVRTGWCSRPCRLPPGFARWCSSTAGGSRRAT